MLVKECMQAQVELASPEMPLVECAQKMRQGDFGAMPVGENDKLVGMVTDRDIVIRAVAEGKDPNGCFVRDVMSKGILYCYEDQTLDEVANNMGTNQVRRLPVLNRQKRLVGILALGDLAQSNASSHQVDETLSQISQPSQDRGFEKRSEF